MRNQREERKTTRVICGAAVCLAALLLAFPCAAQSQDNSTPQDNSTTPQQQPDSFPNHPVTSTLDTGQTIDTDNKVISALRVGHWSLVDFDVFYAFDSNYTFSPTNPSVSNAMAVRALVLYSRQNGDSGIDFQYLPYLLASQQLQQRSIFLDQQLDLHIYRNLNAHWILNLDERLRYEPSSGTLFDPSIIPNYTTGDIFQTPFLATGQKSLQNQVTAALTDTLNARDTLTFHAQYEYANVTNAFGSPNPPAGQDFHTNNTIAGGVSWNHRWHETVLIGVSYTYGRQILGGPSEDQEYNTLLFTYNQRIRPTLVVRFSIGPSIQIHGNGAPSGKTLVGSADLVKTFRSSYLTLNYSRDYGFTGVISDSYHDRYDASYAQDIGRRLVVSAGIGYIQQAYVALPEIDGRDVWGRVDYDLTSRWGIFAQLMNSAAAGPAQPYAARNFLSAGVLWSSQRKHQFQQ